MSEATKMLREELRKQPLLTIFFTPEKWKLELIEELVVRGYLVRCMGPWAYKIKKTTGCHPYSIDQKLKESLLKELENAPKVEK